MTDQKEIARKIVELRIALRRVCMCEDGDKALLSLKTKALFIISQSDRVSPSQLMNSLKIAKPNLTALAKELEKEELIMRSHTLIDRRTILYSITGKGRAYLEERIDRISALIGTAIETPKDADRISLSIDEILRFLSFVSI